MWCTGLVALRACGIFLDQGSNPCPLHWRWILNHCATRKVPLPSFFIQLGVDDSWSSRLPGILPCHHALPPSEELSGKPQSGLNPALHLLHLHPSSCSQLQVQENAEPSGWSHFKLLLLLFFYKFIYFYFFIFGCVGSSFLCEGFLQLQQAGATLHRGARASHYRSLSCCGAQAPDAQAQ